MGNKKYWAIDLGTTNSAIAWSDKDKSEIIKINAKGSIPSVVLFSSDEMQTLPKRTGKLFTTLLAGDKAQIIEEWKVKGMVNSEIANKDFEKFVPGSTPIRLSSLIIKKLIDEAENKTGEKIENISITVPANFSESAKLNTIEAARLAKPKLGIIKLIHEPTAAAMSLLGGSYNVEHLIGKNVMVFDMGGGTTDISLVKFRSAGNNSIDTNVEGTNGANIAGKTIDSRILNDYIFTSIASKTGLKKSELKKDNKVYPFLMYSAERLKIQLANEMSNISYNLNFKYEGQEYDVLVKIKYDDFLFDIRVMFKNLIHTLERLISSSKIEKKDIDFVIIAGGSSQGPWVKQIISEYFGNKNIVKDVIDPETAIAIGGSIISAANFNEGIFEYMSKELMVNEIAPNNIGLGVIGAKINWMINEGTSIPTESKEKTFYFTSDAMATQTVSIEIYESKNKTSFVSQTNLIGVVNLENDQHNKGFKLVFRYENDNSLHVMINQGGIEKEYKVIQKGKLFDKTKEHDREVDETMHELLSANNQLTKEFAEECIYEMKRLGFETDIYNLDEMNEKEIEELILGYSIYSVKMSKDDS